jgi:hypothetical protein
VATRVVAGGLRGGFEEITFDLLPTGPVLPSVWDLAETSARHCSRNDSNSGFDSSIVVGIIQSRRGS